MTVEETMLGEVKHLLTEHMTGIDQKTSEQITTSNKALEVKMVELLQTSQTSALAEWTKKHETDCTRQIQQRTARGPFGQIAGEGEGPAGTIGEQLIQTESYKSFQTDTTRNRRGFSMALKARLRPETKAAATITEPGSGYISIPTRVGVFPQPHLPLVMRDLIPVVPLTTGNSVEYLVETWNYAADYQVLEGDKKAQGDVTYVEKTASAKTIAWFVKVSRQMLQDAPYFAATVDNQLLYGIAKKEDHEILWGDNTAGHLNGIMPQAPALPAAVLPNMTTALDSVAAAIAYLASMGYTPTGIVLNPLDWAAAQIMKNTQGVYLLGGPPTSYAASTLWGLPVVTTMSMTQGNILVGAFPPNCNLFDREAANVEISYENEDDFVRNLATIRAEERIALAVYRPQAFVKGAVTFPPPTGFTAPESAQPKHSGK
jgi:HK97 family phage major capsid protein